MIYDALSTADRGSRNDRCGEINRPAVIIFVRFDFLERNSGAADATKRTSLSLSSAVAAVRISACVRIIALARC